MRAQPGDRLASPDGQHVILITEVREDGSFDGLSYLYGHPHLKSGHSSLYNTRRWLWDTADLTSDTR